MLTFKKRDGSDVFDVIHENGVEIGELYMEVDGYYVFDPIQRYGYWDANTLIKIARRLHKMNRKWHARVCKMWAEHPIAQEMEQIDGDETSSDISNEPFHDISRRAEERSHRRTADDGEKEQQDE